MGVVTHLDMAGEHLPRPLEEDLGIMGDSTFLLNHPPGPMLEILRQC